MAKTKNIAAKRLKDTISRDRIDNSSEDLKYVLSLVTELISDFYKIDESTAKLHIRELEDKRSIMTFTAEII